jgi:hypothetical protein
VVNCLVAERRTGRCMGILQENFQSSGQVEEGLSIDLTARERHGSKHQDVSSGSTPVSRKFFHARTSPKKAQTPNIYLNTVTCPPKDYSPRNQNVYCSVVYLRRTYDVHPIQSSQGISITTRTPKYSRSTLRFYPSLMFQVDRPFQGGEVTQHTFVRSSGRG